MFGRGMRIHEVMADSGYRTASQLFRYVQIFKAREETIDETENQTTHKVYRGFAQLYCV